PSPPSSPPSATPSRRRARNPPGRKGPHEQTRRPRPRPRRGAPAPQGPRPPGPAGPGADTRATPPPRQLAARVGRVRRAPLRPVPRGARLGPPPAERGDGAPPVPLVHRPRGRGDRERPQVPRPRDRRRQPVPGV